jgi:hypothetical protein
MEKSDLNPMTPTTPTLSLVYKNFGAHKGISHIGLGVSALNTAKTLRAKGHTVLIWPVTDFAGFKAALLKNPHVTHVNISAPWFPTMDIAQLAYENPEIKFTITSHSNVGFLQADTRGVQLIREELDLEQNSFNFRTAGNSSRYCQWITETYDRPSLLLPNLYYLDCLSGRPYRTFTGGVLRIGAFGATRPQKNLMTAGAAALAIAKSLRVNLEFAVSAGRNEGGAVVTNSLKEMFANLPYAKIVENGWQQWSDFRRTISCQHLLLQPSYTETFNIVTADGVAEGVPSVVSEAIDWAPKHWKAETDDALDIARVGLRLLHDPMAAKDGLDALTAHNAAGVARWEGWLRS